MKMQNSFMWVGLLLWAGCDFKDDTDATTEETSSVGNDLVGDGDTDGDTDDSSDDTGEPSDEDSDTGTDEGSDTAGEDMESGDTGAEEEVVPDFEVDGVYEGDFSITLNVAFPPITAVCSGDVMFVVDESAEPNVSGTGSCSFDEEGALASYVELGLLDSLGPFEGEPSGEVLTRPSAEGTIIIDTSIGEITTEWVGIFAEATDEAAASFNGEMDGTVELDLGELGLGSTVVDIEYEGSFESLRTGDLPVDDGDTGEADEVDVTE